jgi:hypothetical protein
VRKKPSHATVPLSPAMPSDTLPYSLAGTLSRSPDLIKVNIYGPRPPLMIFTERAPRKRQLFIYAELAL